MTDSSKRGGPEPIVPLKEGDAFWLTDLYPDAKALFEHEQVSLEAASNECIVVLDANVLLLPFEFTSASVGEVERVYADLCAAGRMVVPGQAAREFYKNRSNKITAIADAIDAAITKAKKQIFDKSIPLLENDADYLAARELGKDLINKGRDVAEKLEKVNERLKDEIGADRVSLIYRKILGGCVSDFVVEPADREAVSKEVARRARLKIAPGYKDQQKEDGGIGDYLVWQTILQEGERRKVHCIFVTEEEKPDWWVKRHGTFQPRPELIEEYRRASDGKSLHLLPLSGMLSVFKANENVVQQVQELEEQKRRVSEVRHERISSGTNTMSAKEYDEFSYLQRHAKDCLEKLKSIKIKIIDTKNLLRENGYGEHEFDAKIMSLELSERMALKDLRNAENRLRNLVGRSPVNDDMKKYLLADYLIGSSSLHSDDDIEI
jgi:hypothetical protein